MTLTRPVSSAPYGARCVFGGGGAGTVTPGARLGNKQHTLTVGPVCVRLTEEQFRVHLAAGPDAEASQESVQPGYFWRRAENSGHRSLPRNA
jgi:hypothetical protein